MMHLQNEIQRGEKMRGKETFKRWLVSMLSIAMVVGSLPAPVYADELLLDNPSKIEESESILLDDEESSEIHLEDGADSFLHKDDADTVLLNDLVEEVKFEEGAYEEDEIVPLNKSGEFNCEYTNDGKEVVSADFVTDILGNPNILSDNAIIKLTGDVEISEWITVSNTGNISKNNVVLDLNGHDCSLKVPTTPFASGGLRVLNGYTFTVTDTSDEFKTMYVGADGRISNVSSDVNKPKEFDAHGMLKLSDEGVYISNTKGTINISGNAIITNEKQTKFMGSAGATIDNLQDATFNMLGNSKMVGLSANAFLIKNNGTFNMGSNSIIRGCSVNGDTKNIIYNTGDFDMQAGAMIKDCNANANAIYNSGKFTLAGTIQSCDAKGAVISNANGLFDMKDNAIVDVSADNLMAICNSDAGTVSMNGYSKVTCSVGGSIAAGIEGGTDFIGGNAEISGFGIGISANTLSVSGNAMISANGTNGNKCNVKLAANKYVSFADEFEGSVGVTAESQTEITEIVYITDDAKTAYADIVRNGYVYSDADKYTVEYNSKTRNIYLSPEMVAAIGDDKYPSLQAAVKSANYESKLDERKIDEITLLADFDEKDVLIGSSEKGLSQNIAINLNGHKLGTNIKVEEGSKLTVKDSRKDEPSNYGLEVVTVSDCGKELSHNRICSGNSIKGGFLTGYCDGENSTKPVIENYGTLVLNDGQVIGYHGECSSIRNYGTLNVTNDFAFKHVYAYNGESGGAITNYGVATINHAAAFEDCYALCGGAITNSASQDAQSVLDILGNVKFLNCMAAKCGGAIAAVGGDSITIGGRTSFEGCYVENCCNARASGAFGGAVYSGLLSGEEEPDKLIEVNIRDAKFNNCYVSSNRIGTGGAICTDTNVSLLVSGNTAFSNCAVFVSGNGAAGGALAGLGSTVTLSDNVTFTNCKAKIVNSLTGAYGIGNYVHEELENIGAVGGAVFTFQAPFTIKGTTKDSVSFKNCEAASQLAVDCGSASSAAGGAICSYSGNDINVVNAAIKDCHATSLSANAVGGAIYSAMNRINIADSAIVSCYVDAPKAYGGAIDARGSDLSVRDTEITDCYIDTIYGSESAAGAIYAENSNLVLSGNSKIRGAKVEVEPSGMCQSIGGVAVCCSGKFAMLDDAQISECVVELAEGDAGNESEIYGTVYCSDALISGNAKIKNNSITNKVVSGNVYGAGLCSGGSGNILISGNAVIEGNEVSVANGRVYGAGVYSTTDAEITIGGKAGVIGNVIKECLISNNKVEGQPNNLGMHLTESVNVVSINIAPDFAGKLGVSVCPDEYLEGPVDRIYFTNPILSANIANFVKNKLVVSDYENFKLNYDKKLSKLYLSRHEDDWVLEVKDGVLYGYCTEPTCPYYSKEGECEFEVMKAFAKDYRYHLDDGPKCIYNDYGVTCPTDIMFETVSENRYEFEGTGTTSYNRTTTVPDTPGTYRYYVTVYPKYVDKPMELYADFAITGYHYVTFNLTDSNGKITGKIKGISDNIIVKEVDDNAKAQRPVPNPTVSGNWKFGGWLSSNSTFPDYFDFNTPVLTDLVLLANYVRDYGEVYAEDVLILPESSIDNAKDIWAAGVNGEYFYTGSKWTFDKELHVYDGKKLLVKEKDYTLSYKNNLNVGTAQIVIKGRGNYTKTYIREFKIRQAHIADTIGFTYGERYTKTFTGKAITPIPNLVNSRSGKALKNKKDFEVIYEDKDEKAVTPMAGGEYKIIVKGIGNYCGEIPGTLVITPRGEMSKAKVKGFRKKIAWVDYNHKIPEESKGIKQSGMIVTLDGKTLKEGEDYELGYLDNDRVGIATVVINGIGAYIGSKELTYQITGKSVAKAKVEWDENMGVFPYMGHNQEPYNANTMFKDGKAKLLIDGHAITAEVSTTRYVDVTKKAYFTINGDPRYGFTGSKKLSFRIEPYNIATDGKKMMIFEVSETAAYSKTGAKPFVAIGFGDDDLVEGKDYTLTYKNNKKLGFGTVIIKGKGNFTGKIEKTFEIKAAELFEKCNYIGDEDSEETVVTLLANAVYSAKKNGYKSVPALYEKDSGKTLKQGWDYTVKYYKHAENDPEHEGDPEIVDPKYSCNIGDEFDVVIEGMAPNYTGKAYGSYRIVQYNISKAKASFGNIEYTGSAVELKPYGVTYDNTSGKQSDMIVTFKNKGSNLVTLKEGKDFKVVRYQNNTKKGTAKVTIIATNDCEGIYGGTKTFSFKIKQRDVPDNINDTFKHSMNWNY